MCLDSLALTIDTSGCVKNEATRKHTRLSALPKGCRAALGDKGITLVRNNIFYF